MAHVPSTQRFRGGLVFKAHRLLYHSTIELRVIKKKSNKKTANRKHGPGHYLFIQILIYLSIFVRSTVDADGHDGGRESAHLALLQPGSGLQVLGYFYLFGAYSYFYDTDNFSKHIDTCLILIPIRSICCTYTKTVRFFRPMQGNPKSPLESVFVRWP